MPAIAVGLLFLGGVGLLGRDLWTPDEPRVGEISREVALGAWIVPTLDGEPFLEKPPLYYWSVALVYGALGSWAPERGRVVSALFGLGTLGLVFLIARRLAASRGEAAAARAGALAALALGLHSLYLATTHRLVVDNALVFFTTGSVLGLLCGTIPGRSTRRLLWLATAYVFASLAFLSKGPIGLAVPALALFALAAARREAGVLLRAHVWLAPVCFALVAGPWLVLVYREVGPAGFQILLGENLLGRVVSARSHDRPVYYYAARMALDAFPATLFVVGGLIRRIHAPKALDRAEATAYDLAFGWFGSGLLMLSLAATKRGLYLVPLLPASAVAGGFWLEAWTSGAADDRYARSVGYALAASLLSLALAFPLAGSLLAAEPLPCALAAGLGTVGAALVLRSTVRDERRLALVWMLVSSVVLVGAADWLLLRPLDRQKSLALPARQIAAAIPPGQPIFAVGPDETTRAMLPLYTGRRLEHVDGADLRERRDALGELFLLRVGKHGRWQPDEVEGLPYEILIDLASGPYSRRFQVLRLGGRVANAAALDLEGTR